MQTTALEISFKQVSKVYIEFYSLDLFLASQLNGNKYVAWKFMETFHFYFYFEQKKNKKNYKQK